MVSIERSSINPTVQLQPWEHLTLEVQRVCLLQILEVLEIQLVKLVGRCGSGGSDENTPEVFISGKETQLLSSIPSDLIFILSYKRMLNVENTECGLRGDRFRIWKVATQSRDEYFRRCSTQ
jgi:hypothetical protein